MPCRACLPQQAFDGGQLTDEDPPRPSVGLDARLGVSEYLHHCLDANMAGFEEGEGVIENHRTFHGSEGL